MILLEQDQSLLMGSLQKFIKNAEPSENIAPGRFSTANVHRIGILDIRTLNTDRHGGNILAVPKSSSSSKDRVYDLFPIDHAFCFPTAFGEASWEWLYWPQSKKPFDSETLTYIENIDIEHDSQILRSLGISEDAIVLNRAATMFLKMGAANGLTLYDIAKLCLSKKYKDQQEPSALERAFQTAKDASAQESTSIDATFWYHLKLEFIKVFKPSSQNCSFM